MKKLSLFIFVQLWLIALCLSISAQNFQTIRDGIEHAKLTKQMKSADGKDENVVFNLLRLDLTKVRLDVVHAMDAAIGLEKTSSIATRHGAIAAINAGFFRIDKSIFEGDDVGALMINGKLLSESNNNRVALIISNPGRAANIAMTHLNYSQTISLNDKLLEVTGTNRERGENDLIIYTPEFHLSTLTKVDGIEIKVQKGEVIGYETKIKAKTEIPRYVGGANTKIPQDGFIISASGKYRDLIFDAINQESKSNTNRKIRAVVNAKIDFSDFTDDAEKSKFLKNIFKFNFIVGGVPQLIRNGKIDITWQEEKSSKSFVETHHPRTAVAKLKDGKFLMVTVDGRSEESGGISLPDLAKFLLEMGATDAMNLDGGGSTTMFLDGKVVNKPSDKEGERAVGDAILVFPRK